MKYLLLLVYVSLVGVMLTGCVYGYDEPQPTHSSAIATSTASIDTQKILDLLRGKKPEPPYGIRASSPMPVTGECSYSAAVKSNTDIQYTVPAIRFGNTGQDVGVMHVEKGVTASWPHDIYLKLKAVTPEARDTSAMIIQITRESFESLVPRSGVLRSYVPQFGIDVLAPYFVTTYECLSPSRK